MSEEGKLHVDISQFTVQQCLDVLFPGEVLKFKDNGDETATLIEKGWIYSLEHLQTHADTALNGPSEDTSGGF